MAGLALHCAGWRWRRRCAPAVVFLALAVACSSEPEPAQVARSKPPVTAAATTSVATTTTVPSELLDLIDGVGMTQAGREIFLASDPKVEDPTTFARSCDELSETADEKAHTHGCFTRGRIHLRAVGSSEIADLIYVVAAHELLHAVYSQLDSAERASVDAQLETLRRTTPLLRERLQAYSAADAVAEAHSIAATELSTLPEGLDAYYGRYIDRDKVAAAYDTALGRRDREIRRLRSEVADLDSRVDSERARLDALEAAGDIDAFNAAVVPFNELVAERNRQAETLNTLVQTYNRLIAA